MPTSFSSKITRKLTFRKKPETKTTETYPEPIKTPKISPLVPIKETAKVVPIPVHKIFFFNDKRCQHRALYMTARLKHTLDGFIHPIRPSSSDVTLHQTATITLTPSLSTPITSSSPDTTSKHYVGSFWRTVAHRLYTLNYILFVLPPDSQTRADFLNRVEAELSQKSDGQELFRKGGMEAHFAVRYALERRKPRRRKTLLEDAFEAEKKMGGNVDGAILPSTSSDETRKTDQLVNQARQVIEQCLINESTLSDSEKDAMYIYHFGGLFDGFELRIELEEDRNLRHRLRRMVEKNKPNYENPFEDQDLIVLEDDKASRQVDSGFYDDWNNKNLL